MCVIRVNWLTTADAEDLIRSLWQALEEHGTPSPKLSVYEAGSLLNLHIEFLSEEDGYLIRRCVPRLAAEPLPTAPRLIWLYSSARSYRKWRTFRPLRAGRPTQESNQ
jgi:hypothetical protein